MSTTNHDVTINGTVLTFVEHVTLIKALQAFSHQLHHVGLGNDETAQSATKTYISGIASLVDIMQQEVVG